MFNSLHPIEIDWIDPDNQTIDRVYYVNVYLIFEWVEEPLLQNSQVNHIYKIINENSSSSVSDRLTGELIRQKFVLL